MRRLLLSLALLLTLGARSVFAAAPTRISYTETASWNTVAASKSTASVSWQTNDVVGVMGLNEGGNLATLGNPTATGLTFTTQKSNAGSNTLPGTIVACAVAASTSSGTVSMTNANSTTSVWGFAVWVYRGSAGCGNSAEQHTTTKTVSLTPTAADGAVIWGISDFSGGTAFTAGTPTPTTTDQKVQFAGNYTIGVFDLTDQVSAGAVSYGFTGGGTTGPFGIVVLEIKAGAGGGGGSTAHPCGLRLLGVGCEAVQ